jgi:hypothetical protein
MKNNVSLYYLIAKSTLFGSMVYRRSPAEILINYNNNDIKLFNLSRFIKTDPFVRGRAAGSARFFAR